MYSEPSNVTWTTPLLYSTLGMVSPAFALVMRWCDMHDTQPSVWAAWAAWDALEDVLRLIQGLKQEREKKKKGKKTNLEVPLTHTGTYRMEQPLPFLPSPTFPGVFQRSLCPPLLCM